MPGAGDAFAAGMSGVLLACALLVALCRGGPARASSRPGRGAREAARLARRRVNLRERKKAETRQRIQEEAMRLFLEHGYDATTVEQIAAAAGVSHMTFFRHFPTKDDVVVTDDYDPLIAELIRARPADEHPVERVRATILQGLAAVYATDRDTILARAQLIESTPALRARVLDNQRATEALFARALASPGGEDGLEVRVLAAACVAALITAVTRWAEHPGDGELPELVDRAFRALREQAG